MSPLARPVLCFLAAWTLVVAGKVQAQTTPDARQPVHIPLWEARKGLIRISLVGERHDSPLGVTSLPDALIDRVRESDAIGFELRPSDVRRFTGIDHQGRLISQRIPPALWQRIIAEVGPKRQGGLAVDPAKLDRLAPYLAAATIEAVAQQRYLGWQDRERLRLAPGALGWASLVAREAVGKPVLSLDTIASMDHLWDYCDRTGKTAELLERSLTVWSEAAYRTTVAQDLPTMVLNGQVDEIVQAFAKHPHTNLMLTCAVTPRNHLWQERIRQHAKLYFRPFYVVGAAHLGGSDGLLALLRKDGYIVRRIYTQTLDKRSAKPG